MRSDPCDRRAEPSDALLEAIRAGGTYPAIYVMAENDCANVKVGIVEQAGSVIARLNRVSADHRERQQGDAERLVAAFPLRLEAVEAVPWLGPFTINEPARQERWNALNWVESDTRDWIADRVGQAHPEWNEWVSVRPEHRSADWRKLLASGVDDATSRRL